MTKTKLTGKLLKRHWCTALDIALTVRTTTPSKFISLVKKLYSSSTKWCFEVDCKGEYKKYRLVRIK